MGRGRISIAGMLALIGMIALGLAAFRHASELWAGSMVGLALLTLGFAVLGALFRRGERRAFWTGFALFGSGYALFALGPWDFGRNLATTVLLDELNARINPPVPLYSLTDPGGMVLVSETPDLETVQAELDHQKARWKALQDEGRLYGVNWGGMVSERGFTLEEAQARAESDGPSMPFPVVNKPTIQKLGPNMRDPATLRINQALDWSATNEVSQHVHRIGHALIAMALALLGGLAARLLDSTRGGLGADRRG